MGSIIRIEKLLFFYLNIGWLVIPWSKRLLGGHRRLSTVSCVSNILLNFKQSIICFYYYLYIDIETYIPHIQSIIQQKSSTRVQWRVHRRCSSIWRGLFSWFTTTTSIRRYQTCWAEGRCKGWCSKTCRYEIKQANLTLLIYNFKCQI